MFAQWIGQVAYKLTLPQTLAGLHPVFYVSRLNTLFSISPDSSLMSREVEMIHTLVLDQAQ